MTARTDARPRVLPWSLALLVGATAAVAIGATAMASPNAVPAAVAGVIVGLLGPIVGSAGRTACAALIVAALALAFFRLPPELSLVLAAAILAGLAGWEAARPGGRSFTIALLGLLVLLPNLSQVETPWISGIVFVASAAVGMTVARLNGIEGFAAQPPGGIVLGVMVFAFQTVGLTLAFVLMSHFAVPQAGWIAQMFVLRGLAAPPSVGRSALKYATGAMVGAAVAALILATGIAFPLRLALSIVLVVLGLRLIPHPLPLTPALMSAAVVLSSAPTFVAAVFRIEAALIAALIAMALALAIEWVWARWQAGTGGTIAR